MTDTRFSQEDALALLASLQAARALISRFAMADASASALHDALHQRTSAASADLASLQMDLVQLLSMTSDPNSPHVVAQICLDKTSPAFAIGPTVFADRETAAETIAKFGSRRRTSGTLAFPMPEAFVAYLPGSMS